MKETTMATRHRSIALALRATALVCLGALIVAPLAWSQSIETGAITGSVTDEQGAALPGVTITLTSPEKGTTASSITDGSGRYRLM